MAFPISYIIVKNGTLDLLRLLICCRFSIPKEALYAPPHTTPSQGRVRTGSPSDVPVPARACLQASAPPCPDTETNRSMDVEWPLMAIKWPSNDLSMVSIKWQSNNH